MAKTILKKYKYNKYNKTQQANKQDVILNKMFYINIWWLL